MYIFDHNKGRVIGEGGAPSICLCTFPQSVACLLWQRFIRCGNCPDTLQVCQDLFSPCACGLGGFVLETQGKRNCIHPFYLFVSTWATLQMLVESEDRTPSATKRFVSYLLGATTGFCLACRCGLCTAIFGSSFRTSCFFSYPV